MTIEEMKLRYTPKMAIKEELGGGYYYRCCWVNCDTIVKSEWRFCPYCGQLLKFPNDDYEENEDG